MSKLIPFSRRNNSLITSPFEDLYNMMDNFFNHNWPSAAFEDRGTFKIDIQEDDKEYVVEAHLPGVKKDEVNIELNEGKLMISVTRDEKVEEDKKNYVYRESRKSSMSRGIYLEEAASEGVKARLDDGILSIIVPKKEKLDNTKKIEIE